MAVLTVAKLLELIKEHGFSVRRTDKSHYVVVDAEGKDTDGRFAVGHGKNKGMVQHHYVNDVLRAIRLK